MGPLLIQRLDNFQEVGDRSGQAIDPDDLQYVACLHGLDQAGKLRPGAAGARGLFHHQDVKAVLPQLVGLRV
jgi:hypothetical protein